MKLWLLVFFFTLSSFAQVGLAEKEAKIQSLQKLKKYLPSLNLDVYSRDLNYEKQNLSLEERTTQEVSKVVNQLREAIKTAYIASVKASEDPEAAVKEITGAIEQDIELVNPVLKEELKKVALTSLDEFAVVGYSSKMDFTQLNNLMRSMVQERMDFMDTHYFNSPQAPEVQKTNFESKEEILASLTAEGRGFISTGKSKILKTSPLIEKEDSLQIPLRVDFLGVSLPIGPFVKLNRYYRTNVSIKSVDQKLVAFSCDASLVVEGSIKKEVKLNSREIALPKMIAGEKINSKLLSEICHRDFLNSWLSSSVTVSDALNVMMRSMVSAMKLSHPKVKCQVDSDCQDWFDHKVLTLHKLNNLARCVSANNSSFCALRAQKGRSCGEGQVACDKGLRCVETKAAHFFLGKLVAPAQGQCR